MYQLVQDNDSHWYVIPCELLGPFNEWLEACVDGEATDVFEFWRKRVDGPHTVRFTQWEEQP